VQGTGAGVDGDDQQTRGLAAERCGLFGDAEDFGG
jgi:hypothetical protein